MFSTTGTPDTRIIFLFLILRNLPRAELHMMDFGKCNQPLGMADGKIKDEDISVTRSIPNHGLSSARLGHTNKEGRITAWCPAYIPYIGYGYIEVRLTKEHLITRVERRLFSEKGIGLKDTEPSVTFTDYYRPKLNEWRSANFKNFPTQYDAPDASLLKPFRATILHIGFKFFQLLDEIEYCLQVEIYGCSTSDGIVSYDMKRSRLHKQLYMNYDGNFEGKLLSKGLGDLVDGNFGDQVLTENGNVTPEIIHSSDNGWIGWNKDWQANLPVEFIFEFDDVRQFFEMVVYALNIIGTEEIRPFLIAKVHFSNDSINYVKHYSIVYHANEAAPQIQYFSVSLKQRLAQYLKIQFFLDTKWMFISEIIFNSSLVEAVLQGTDDKKVGEVSSSSTQPSTKAIFQNIDGVEINEGFSSTVNQSPKAVFQNTTGMIVPEVSTSANNQWSSGRFLTFFIVSTIFIGLLILVPLMWLVIKLRRVILTNHLNNSNREEVLNFIGKKTQFPLRP